MTQSDNSILTKFTKNQDLFNPGDLFYGYMVIDKLSRGGFSSVYLARRQKDKRLFVIKAIPKSRRFTQREVINEVNVSKYLSMECSCLVLTDMNMVIMKYVPGEDLFDVDVVERSYWAGIFIKVAKALKKIHDKGLVHNDVKPENIRYDGKNVTFIDFGFTRAYDEKVAKKRCILIHEPDGYRGTINYAAPEVFETETLDPIKSDIYSLGVTWYVLLTGTFPYPGNDLEYVAHVMNENHPPSPIEIKNEEMDPDLPRLIFDMITSRPEDRPDLNSVLSRLKKIKKQQKKQMKVRGGIK